MIAMLDLIAAEAAKVALLVALPVLGGVVVEGVRILGSRALEAVNPGIRVLKRHYSAIDLAMRFSSPELRNEIADNPVAAFAKEILSEEPALTAPQVERAIKWAAAKFDYNIHSETFRSATPEQEALRNRIIERLQNRIA